MANATTLLANNFKQWISARGFILVVAAALVPLVLTGAWVATHQADVAATDVTWAPDPITEGQKVNVTGTIVNKGRFDIGGFNATIQVGTVSNTASGVSFIRRAGNTTHFDGLKAGESKEVMLNWTSQDGYYVVWSAVDDKDALPELDEFNNDKFEWMVVGFGHPDANNTPLARQNLTGPSGLASADVAITELTWVPSVPKPGDNVTYTAKVTNNGPGNVTDANVTLQVGQSFGRQIFSSYKQERNVTLAPGASTTVTLTANNIRAMDAWAEAFVNVTTASDPNGDNNWKAEWAAVQPDVGSSAFPEPPEKATIKQFYLDILVNLHVRVLLPLIGLFYAAGVVSDEREKGNLVYVLTRPVPRALIPVLKFVSSFLVASVAVVVGVIATFFLLLGTPQGEYVGFLTTPLLVSLTTLFVYGAFFILLGVLVERPYLVGLGLLVGWEAIAGNFVPWVKNLTISNHIFNVLVGKPEDVTKPETLSDGWRLDQGLQWLPSGTFAQNELYLLLGLAIVFLIASVVVMRSREFDI